MPGTRDFATDLTEGYSLLCRLERDSEWKLLTVIEGVIRSPAKRAVGSFAGLEIDLSRSDFGDELTHPFLNLEGYSHASMELWLALLEDGKPLAPLIEARNSDLLYLERLWIAPEHRGRKFGLNACAAIMAFFSEKCAYAAMKPFPLQWEGKLGDGTNDRRYRKDLRKLVSYYAPLRFDHGPHDAHYYRELGRGLEILGFTRGHWTRQLGVRFPTLYPFDAGRSRD